MESESEKPTSVIGQMSLLLLASYDKLVAALAETQRQEDENDPQESK